MAQSAPVGGWPYFDGITTKNNHSSPQNNIAKWHEQRALKQTQWFDMRKYGMSYYACPGPDLRHLWFTSTLVFYFVQIECKQYDFWTFHILWFNVNIVSSFYELLSLVSCRREAFQDTLAWNNNISNYQYYSSWWLMIIQTFQDRYNYAVVRFDVNSKT